MDINAVSFFENHNSKMKKLRKKSYTKNMEDFRAEKGDELKAFIDLYNSSVEDKESASVTDEFTSQVFEAFAKKGKVKASIKMDLNLFMILYVFPAILLSGDANATVLCDELKKSWNSKFSENIDYTDFDTLLGGFNDKIFGIF